MILNHKKEINMEKYVIKLNQKDNLYMGFAHPYNKKIDINKHKLNIKQENFMYAYYFDSMLDAQIALDKYFELDKVKPYNKRFARILKIIDIKTYLVSVKLCTNIEALIDINTFNDWQK